MLHLGFAARRTRRQVTTYNDATCHTIQQPHVSQRTTHAARSCSAKDKKLSNKFDLFNTGFTVEPNTKGSAFIMCQCATHASAARTRTRKRQLCVYTPGDFGWARTIGARCCRAGSSKPGNKYTSQQSSERQL
jgi:hypothetical protein